MHSKKEIILDSGAEVIPHVGKDQSSSSLDEIGFILTTWNVLPEHCHDLAQRTRMSSLELIVVPDENIM